MADDDTKDDTPEESEGKPPEPAEGDTGGPASGETAPRAEGTDGTEAEGAEGAEDEPPGDAGDEESEPATGIRAMLTINKKLIIIVAAALFLVGGGVALVFTGALDSLIGGGQKRASMDLPGPPVLYEFPALLVDLKTGRCRSPFIKLRAVALVSEPDMDRLTEVEAQVLDAFQGFLRDHERQDLVGKAGTDKLRQGFLSILNTALAPAQAQNVLFREILLQ
ncbi:MAG: flagellar basal body-associated FliL family protein [Rhodospirillales bacterium]